MRAVGAPAATVTSAVCNGVTLTAAADPTVAAHTATEQARTVAIQVKTRPTRRPQQPDVTIRAGDPPRRSLYGPSK